MKVKVTEKTTTLGSGQVSTCHVSEALPTWASSKPNGHSSPRCTWAYPTPSVMATRGSEDAFP